MKVVIQSSSLVFTLLSILLNVPITRVKRKLAEPSPQPTGSAK